MTEKQFEELKIGDIVKIYGVLGKVVKKDQKTFTVMSRAFGVDDYNDFGTVSFAWNEGEPLESRKPLNMKETEDSNFFTLEWLKDNIDLEDPRLKDPYDFHVEIYIDDKDGCIDIVYCGDVYWTITKSSSKEEWYVSMDSEPRNDSWLPSVVTIEDFKRLFRVAAGFDLPLKNDEKMTTEEKIAHNNQVEQERAAYHKRRCEESDAYKRVYERMMSYASHDAMQSQSVVNAIQMANLKGTFHYDEKARKIMARQRKEIESVESASIPDGLVKCYFDMLFTDNISEDLQAIKEISEAEQAFNSKLERFDKYEL